jgi:hypothetical protein
MPTVSDLKCESQIKKRHAKNKNTKHPESRNKSEAVQNSILPVSELLFEHLQVKEEENALRITSPRLAV